MSFSKIKKGTCGLAQEVGFAFTIGNKTILRVLGILGKIGFLQFHHCLKTITTTSGLGPRVLGYTFMIKAEIVYIHICQMKKTQQRFHQIL